VLETPVTLYVTVGAGVLVGVIIGLLVLRFTLQRLKKDEQKRRGYTREEMAGIDNFDPTDDM
jgi:uncharacterized membrane-anchored protein YhcB (DUF1043 family)